MVRHPEPDFMIKWRTTRNTPKCCHTCASYTEGGSCIVFDSEPPLEFANTVDKCDKWSDETPL